MKQFVILLTMMLTVFCHSCKAEKSIPAAGEDSSATISAPKFNRDSAYYYVEKLVSFGPRVPNTDAHVKAGNWLTETLKSFGMTVIEQKADLKAFDGTNLKARNIFAQINPDSPDRILLLAHWDCRPWADQDPDPEKRNLPVDGANDGASGVGVLLEIARQLSFDPGKTGVDILFVDAEDWGSEGDDESWALGTRYFAQNPPIQGYKPRGAILLDMVGSEEASFGREYFSEKSAPQMLNDVWGSAASLGYNGYFHSGFGGAVTDDHVELIKEGIPAIDIIDFRNTPDYQGFDPVWHTSFDNMRNISKNTLGVVGETILLYINSR